MEILLFFSRVGVFEEIKDSISRDNSTEIAKEVNFRGGRSKLGSLRTANIHHEGFC